MDAELMERLTRLTAEEEAILAGKGLDRRIYSSDGEFIVDSRRMLASGRLIDIRPHTRFIRFPKHRHNYVEIVYMCAGKTVHTINDGEKVVLEAGNLLFLNQFSSHEIEPAGREDVAVNFIVLPEFFDTALSMIGRESAVGAFLISTLCGSDSEGKYLLFRVADQKPVQNLIENLLWSVCGDGYAGNRINETTMGLLLMQLLQHSDRLTHSEPNRFENRLVMRSLEYIEEQYRTATLRELSQLTGQSVFRLCRSIREGTGSGFKDLLLEKRLRRAAELLSLTGLSVADIIDAVGYSNTSYFYRVFRDAYGMSPSEYRGRQEKDTCK